MSKKLTIIALAVLFLGAFSVLATADEPCAAAPQPAAVTQTALFATSAQVLALADGSSPSSQQDVGDPVALGDPCSYRWVGAGCNCNLVFGSAWQEKEQQNCGWGWYDTGNTRCTNYPC